MEELCESIDYDRNSSKNDEFWSISEDPESSKNDDFDRVLPYQSLINPKPPVFRRSSKRLFSANRGRTSHGFGESISASIVCRLVEFLWAINLDSGNRRFSRISGISGIFQDFPEFREISWNFGNFRRRHRRRHRRRWRFLKSSGRFLKSVLARFGNRRDDFQNPVVVVVVVIVDGCRWWWRWRCRRHEIVRMTISDRFLTMTRFSETSSWHADSQKSRNLSKIDGFRDIG